MLIFEKLSFTFGFMILFIFLFVEMIMMGVTNVLRQREPMKSPCEKGVFNWNSVAKRATDIKFIL